MIRKPKAIRLTLNSLIILLLLSAPLPAFSKEQLKMKEQMTHKEFKDAGLDQLSPEQIKILNAWLNDFVARENEKNLKGGDVKKEKRSLFQVLFKPDSTAYEIQDVHKNHFKINNHEFEMIKKCPEFKKGDKVIFKKGSANSICKTATFIKPESKERCQVWCEEE